MGFRPGRSPSHGRSREGACAEITHMAMQGRGRGLGCVHPVAKSPIKMVEGATQKCYTDARDHLVQVLDFSVFRPKNAPSPRERHAFSKRLICRSFAYRKLYWLVGCRSPSEKARLMPRTMRLIRSNGTCRSEADLPESPASPTSERRCRTVRSGLRALRPGE